MEQKIVVTWYGAGRKAQCPPNPQYPKGVDVDVSQGRLSCSTALPYPAPECGYWTVRCHACQWMGAITAAGRADDPRSVTIPCKQSFS